ncbi:SGNH/GDSL hydrolase family protein [Salinispira pacifica]|uniref:Putative lysophospholipase L1 n=1 Tax=Salinispira pacifica TaxID=1307761 RepID=V5WK61_9SPIO|nr:SGNH/GDSL hydrolase family protein [Salinispira pacifica]AHC16138.1 Putative lysophospholipase L1 [Salinispira pacifica]
MIFIRRHRFTSRRTARPRQKKIGGQSSAGGAAGIVVPIFMVLSLLPAACSSQGELLSQADADARYLALGDSYTIGESVEADRRWPAILARNLENRYPHSSISVQYRARTGWTTGNLLSSLMETPPENSYDAVSLLIGVNNQFQGLDFSTYRQDVPRLIALARNYSSEGNIFVLSIPDYSYTPYGGMLSPGDRERISREIDEYNSWMEEYCRQQGIPFVNITPITRQAIDNPDLVADDGLHPSAQAYRLFAEEIIRQIDIQALLDLE